MEAETVIQFIIAIVGALLVVPLSTTVHELGHAISGLILTRKTPVKVFLGSYGIESPALRISLGRLKIFIHKRVFRLIRGLVDFDHVQVKPWGIVFLILNGALFSLLISGTFLTLALTLDWGFGWKIFAGIWAVTVVVQSVKDLVPSSRQILRPDGPPTYNDGKLIRDTLRFIRQPGEAQEMLRKFWAGDYAGALEGLEELWAQGRRERLIFQTAMECCRDLGDPKSGAKWSDRYHASYSLSENELALSAWFYQHIGEVKKAFHDMDHALAENPAMYAVLINRGYLNLTTENFAAALSDFNRAIDLNPNDPTGWAMRGYYYAVQGDLEKAESDLTEGEELHEENPLIHGLWGFFWLKKGDKKKALDSLNKVNLNDKTVEISLKEWVVKWKAEAENSG